MLQYRAGEVKVHHDVVRVTPLMSHISLRALVAGTDLPSPVKSPSRAATEIVGGPRGAVELDVNVNYVAGCQRGHISRLSLPVLPPFRCSNAVVAGNYHVHVASSFS